MREQLVLACQHCWQRKLPPYTLALTESLLQLGKITLEPELQIFELPCDIRANFKALLMHGGNKKKIKRERERRRREFAHH